MKKMFGKFASVLLLSIATNVALANSVVVDDTKFETVDPFAKLKSLVNNNGSEVLSKLDLKKYNEPGYLFELVKKRRDVSAVPVPAALWLMGSGLLGLLGVSRARKA